MNILIAEDDPVTARILELAVGKYGHAGRVAMDGQKAWEVFQEWCPDIVISDWMMPRMDGLELLRRVRKHAGGTSTYTYFLFETALGERQQLQEAMQEGADDYLVKPVDPVDLQIRLTVAGRFMALYRQLESRNVELEVQKDQLYEEARHFENLVSQA